MKPEEIARAGLSRIGVVSVRTALNPLLWLTGLVTPSSLAAMLLAGDPTLRLLLVALAAFPPVFTALCYLLFALRDPARLQSEEYRLRERAMQIIYRKGDVEDVVDIVREEPRREIRRGPAGEGE